MTRFECWSRLEGEHRGGVYHLFWALTRMTPRLIRSWTLRQLLVKGAVRLLSGKV